MTRLTIGWLMVLVTAIVATICRYVLHGVPEASIVVALVSALTALVLKGIVAIKNRNPAEPDVG